MIPGVRRALGWVVDHYVVVCLFLALFILSLLGVGSSITVGTLGLMLCMIGIVQKRATVDLWVLVPLILYALISMASSYETFHNIVVGYAATQSIFLVIYLLRSCLDGADQRLLHRMGVVWAGVVAALGIGQFTYSFIVAQSVKRLDGLLGNPNALGIFLVIWWFALMRCVQQAEDGDRRWLVLFRWMEPVLLAALALTLSLGSFLAMAVGIFVLLLEHKRQSCWKDVLFYGCRILAKATLGIGTGVMLYLAADRTGALWLFILLLVYVLAEAACWAKLEKFLEEYRWMSAVMTAAGVLVAAAAVVIRPSSLATFSERLAMMRNGLGYLLANPLLGVGPYQWRVLNLSDGDKYFNTYHIHNMFIHIGAELGVAAMVMMLIIAVRCFRKRGEHPGWRAQCASFLCHNLMDTSFFYLGITSAMLITAGECPEKERQLHWVVSKILFALLAAMFLHNLYYFAR